MKVSIKSNTAILNCPVETAFKFLCVPENYRVLMPSRVRSFEATEHTALLDIEGIGKLELAFGQKTEFSYIELIPQNKLPFKFTLHWNLEGSGDKTTVQATIDAELNLMMKMMAEKLLKDFLDVQVHKLTKQFSE